MTSRLQLVTYATLQRVICRLQSENPKDVVCQFPQWLCISVRIFCYTTEMFTLPNTMSQVSSAAFAQARLRPGSGLLRSAHPIYTLARIHQLLTSGPKKAPLPLARDPKYLPCMI